MPQGRGISHFSIALSDTSVPFSFCVQIHRPFTTLSPKYSYACVLKIQDSQRQSEIEQVLVRHL